ncbi:MAG TPA: NEW3 domain-containing protein, partial [archaeon]|nr:NEW3 domain-containing protein [archaeon]
TASALARDTSGNTAQSASLPYTVIDNTAASLTPQPSSITISNVTYSENSSFVLTITFNNTGLGGAYNTNISLSMPTNISANATLVSCGKVGENGSVCTASYLITALPKIAAGNFTVNVTANWTNPDNTAGSNSTPFIVTIADKSWTASPAYISLVAYQNTSGNITINISNIGDFNQNISVNSTGNITQFITHNNHIFVANKTNGTVTIFYNLSLSRPIGIYNGSIILINRTAFPPEINITLQVNVTDNILPSISAANISLPLIEAGFASLNISANVTDNINISRVWANITSPQANSTNFMSNISNVTYRVEFTPSKGGVHNITIYANDTSGNIQTLSAGVFTSIGAAGGPTNVTPIAITVANMTFKTNVTLQINITLGNNGPGTMRYANITVIEEFSGAWSTPSKTQYCANISANTNCTVSFNITLPLGASSGSRDVLINSTWISPDLTINYTSNFTDIIVQSNPKINITNPSMLKTIDHGVTLTDNFTIEDVGNALISGISYNISGGNLPISWLTLDPTSGTTTSLAAGANFTVLIQIAVPQSQLAGSYATIMNATSSNGGYDEMLLNVTVPVNGSWSYAPSSISASTPIGTSGNFTINVTNLGNINLTFAVVGSGNATGMLGIPDDRPTTPGIMFPLVINYSIPSGQTPGVYGVTMQISNASGSPTLQSTVITMIVGDTAPTIAGELVTQTAFDLNFQTTDIRANVTDNNAVSSVIATVYKPSGVDNITLAKIISTNTYNATYTPDQAGNYTIVINATDNSGLTTFSSPVVFNVTGATTVKVTSNISSITLSNITLAQGATIPLNITFNNTGTGAARHSNLTFSLPSGWSASQSTIPMGNISKGTNATTTVIITVPANTSATSYTITPTATWTQPNQSLEINTTSITVTVSSNPVLRINEDSVTATTQHGTTLTVNATLNSTGNAVATNASLLCTSALCTNFSVTFNVSSLTLAQNAVRVGINISVPLGQDPGVYSLTVNTSTSSDYMIINVTVPTNTSWTRSPASLPDVKIGANTAGNFNTLNITSFANVIILLNISIEGNITNYTTTNVTQLSLGKLETVSVRVNFTSPSVGGIYNGNVTITNSSGVPSQLNTSLLLNVTQFTITIISPTSTSIINTSAGSLINITANATLAGEAIAENITWTVAVGGSSCAVNSSSFSAGWLIRCAAPSLPDGVLYNLQLTGNYTTLVTVSTQTETNAVRYTDSSPPQFASISRPLVEKGNNVTIIANITENTNVSAVTINITYPNGTIQKFNMTNISSDTARSNWTVLITDATARGDYDFTITANDTFGNQNSSSSFFSIFEPVSVSGTSLDPDNDVINMTLKFYRENHNLSANTLLQTVATLGNGSYSGTINNRTYDLEVDYGGHSLVFKNVNVSNNVIDPVLLDDLPTKYMTITGSRGPLKGLAVKSNINASSINVTFSFTGTAFTHINAIKLYKCAVHNFTQPSLGCTGTWEKLSPVLNVVNETAYATVSTLSIFAAAEEVRCGDNICDINFGESSVTCSADCGSASTGASGGGGGGGGGISQSQLREELQTLKKSTATPQSFSVETDLIDTIMSPGETKIFSLFLSNNEDKPAESIISAIGPATRFLTFDNTHVSINGSETALVKITAYIPEDTLPGIYSGDVQITVGDEQRNMPVTITVASEKDAVIDVALDIITKEVELNSSLRFKVTLTNIGFQKHKALNITYNVREASSESLIASFHENITLDETRSTFTRAFSMMGVKNITLGKYFLEAVISYNDKTSVAIDLFDVVEQFWTPFRVMLVTLSAGSLASVYAGYRIRKAYLRRRSSKKRYASPLEWKSLPKGELWLGKIGETEKEATFKLDDLTTHVLTAGATGSGKSVSAMVIVEEALKKKLPVVVFDPTAQWTGFVRPDTEQGMLNTFKKFKMKQEDARPFKGLIYEITDVNVQIDIRKYMNPGEITVFTLNKLKPGEYDQAVQNIVNMIFSITWEESSSLKMLVCFDEVHRLLEKYGGKGGYTALEKACREFRKWGIGIVMVSQVLSDFKEALRGNVLTEVQMHTKLLEDIDRVKTKYGEEYSNRITRQEVGVGMIQNPKYNNGRPWFVNFRPLLHSPHKITESQMNTYKKFTSKMQEIETQIEELKTRKIDTTDIELELKLCKDKVKTGVFRTAEIYIESMEESLKRYKGRAAK